MHAIRHPDGAFQFGNSRYRLVERGDGLYEVVAERDGSVAGRLRMATHGRTPDVEVLPGAATPGVIEAISKLLGSPRGAVPLQ